MNEDDDDKLMAAASGLATEIDPARDLWPGIEEAIRRPRRRPWTPMLAQAAMALLLVGASSMVTYFVIREEPQVIEVRQPALSARPVSLAGPGTLGAEYGRARHAAVSQLESELERLSPETRADVERNLAVIRYAIADISAALQEEPDSQLLRQLLVDAYREEIMVMQKVGRLTSHVMSRQDI
jgi:hypothetical protein